MDNEQTTTSAADERREYVKPQLQDQPDWDVATGQIPVVSQPDRSTATTSSTSADSRSGL